MRAIQAILLSVVLCLCQPVIAQSTATGFLDGVSTVNGKAYRYQVYVPTEYRSEIAWPLILFLHGAGERGSDGLRQTTVGIGPAIRHDPSRFPAIVLFPQAPAGSQWVGAPAEAAMSALRQTLKDFHVDQDRVYLTGLSMGGHGAWYLAYRNPTVFAAIAPICGWVADSPNHKHPESVVPSGDGPALTALTQRLRHMPVWIFHGEMDDVVPAEESRTVATALRVNGANVRYTEFHGLGHNSWDAAYALNTFVSWLLAQRRTTMMPLNPAFQRTR